MTVSSSPAAVAAAAVHVVHAVLGQWPVVAAAAAAAAAYAALSASSAAVVVGQPAVVDYPAALDSDRLLVHVQPTICIPTTSSSQSQ